MRRDSVPRNRHPENLLFCGSALGAAFATELWHLLAARVLGGLAVGCASLITPLYLAEIAPATVRGRLVTMYQLAIVTGILAAFFVIRFVPETKLRSLESIQELWGRQPAE